MRAAGRQPQTPAEHESYEAVYAYEEALSSEKGRRVGLAGAGRLTGGAPTLRVFSLISILLHDRLTSV